MPDPLAVIHDLAAFPPLNAADLRERTRDCTREELVEALEAVIEDSDSEIEQSSLLEVLEKIDPQHEWVAPAAPAAARSGDDSGEGASGPAKPAELPPERQAELEHELIEAVMHLVATPADGAAIAERIRSLPPPVQERFIRRLDRARVESGVPAPLFFEPLLAHPLGAEAKAAVDAALAQESTRRRFVEGFAWLSSCDGTGAASLFAGLRNPDGTHTVVHVVHDVHAGIRDAFALARQTKKAIERMQEQLRSDGVEFVRAPIELAARLVADAAERGHAAGLTLATEIEQALALLAPVKLAPRPPRAEPLLMAMPPAPIEQLFLRDEYASWFLDAGELLDAGVPRPAPGADPSDWADQALPKLDRLELRARLSAMAAYMARWHELRREPQLAALLRAMAWPPSRSFVGDALSEHAEAESPCSGAPANELFFGLVARSFFLAAEQMDPPSVLAEVGDPQFRQGLKERRFASIESPTGRDLARLDLAELFLLLFDQSLPVVAPSRRPKPGDLEPLALRLADAVIAWREGGVGRRAAVQETVAKALVGEGSRFTEGDAAALAEQFTPALVEEFLRRACGACPARCWDALDAGAAAPFFATQHPASEALEAFAAEQDAAEQEEDESRDERS
jgi:hypothetical protein